MAFAQEIIAAAGPFLPDLAKPSAMGSWKRKSICVGCF
jgi:hypothetical protein